MSVQPSVFAIWPGGETKRAAPESVKSAKKAIIMSDTNDRM